MAMCSLTGLLCCALQPGEPVEIAQALGAHHPDREISAARWFEGAGPHAGIAFGRSTVANEGLGFAREAKQVASGGSVADRASDHQRLHHACLRPPLGHIWDDIFRMFPQAASNGNRI